MKVPFSMFQTRSPERDKEQDRARIERMRRAVAGELQAAINERDGLTRRRERDYAVAATSLSQLGEFGERSAADEQSISELERNAERANTRIKNLTIQIESIRKLLAGINELDNLPSQ
ncbi:MULTISPECIES: hypothetical protein [unclassified Devosia]|uniref:hypothetical protein n=1 Tax=unclassified Devosia TaxID=196773 RepID=UPI000FDBAF26|nr:MULTISPECIES: hypothetical protein [unclassified Devosia]